MSNVDRPNGARPVMQANGSPWCGTMAHFLADGSGSDIFVGDFVKMEADGKIDVASAGDVHLIGVCMGFLKEQPAQTKGVHDHFISTGSTSPERIYYDSSADGEKWILVSIGQDVLYEMQEDDVDGTTLDIDSVGANANILATAGSTTRGASLQEIDRSTLTTGTAQLRIVRPVDRPDNEVNVASSRWLVRINENHYQVIDDGSTTEGFEGV